MGRRSRSNEWGGTNGIEFVAPDPDAFGRSTGADADTAFDAGATWDDDRPRSAWATLGAVGVVGALVAGAVAVAAPWHGDAAAPTTSVTSTTVTPTPDPTTTLLPTVDGGGQVTTGAAAPATGLLIDPPAGWSIAGALTSAANDDFDGWGEVWAEPTASRAAGRWYALSLAPYGLDGASVTNAVRVAIGARTALVEQADDGVLTLTVEVPFERRPRLLRIEAGGTTVDELTAFAASIGIEDDRPQLVDDRFVFRDPTFLDGLDLAWSGPTDWDPVRTATVGSLRAFTLYRSDTGDWLWLGIGDADSLPAAVALLEFEQTTVELPELASGMSNVQVGRTPQRSHVRFSFDDVVVSAVSTLDEDELVALLPTVRRASLDEWAAARRTANSGSAGPPWGALVDIDRTLPAGGTSWSMSIETQGRYAEIEIFDDSGRSSSIIELFADGDDPIGVVSTIDTTVVVARRPGPHTLTVTTSDGTVLEFTFVDAGAVQVDAFGPFQVVLRDATGQVVDTQ